MGNIFFVPDISDTDFEIAKFRPFQKNQAESLKDYCDQHICES